MQTPSDINELDGMVAQVLAGNRDAYRGIVERCETKVRVVLAAMLSDSTAVDDLAQETFVTAFRKLDQYKPGTNLPAWVAAIARNLALNERRAEQRRLAATQRHTDLVEVDSQVEAAVDAMGSSLSDETSHALRICMDKLAAHTRELVNARYLEQVSIEDLVRRTNRNAAGVRLLLHRARLALADCLQRRGVCRHA